MKKQESPSESSMEYGEETARAEAMALFHLFWRDGNLDEIRSSIEPVPNLPDKIYTYRTLVLELFDLFVREGRVVRTPKRRRKASVLTAEAIKRQRTSPSIVIFCVLRILKF